MMQISEHTIEAAVLAVSLLAGRLLNMRTGHNRDKDAAKHRRESTNLLTSLQSSINDLDAKIDGTDDRLTLISSILIGPDGKNGLRGRVESLERTRERDIEQKLKRGSHGSAD